MAEQPAPNGSRPAVLPPADPHPAAPVDPAGFEAFRLQPATLRGLAEAGINVPTPIQAEAIPALLAGRDIVGQARTGSGKTLAFAIPILERVDSARPEVQALVLVPTRELAIQVADVVTTLIGQRRLKLTLLYGGRSLLNEQKALRTGIQIVVGTPGRTLDHLRQGNLSLKHLRIAVLDEADEMLDRGFAPDVERILAMTPTSRQTALLSATVPDWVLKTAEQHLRNPVQLHVDRNVAAPPEIEHLVYEVDAGAKLGALQTLLDQRGDAPMIVFGRTKHGVKKLAKQLTALGYPVGALQGNLSQNARERVMAEFRAGTLPILLATNVAARGIDVEGIGQVINYELPESAEWFTHRAGRTGRMGRAGEAITFLTPDDADKWKQIEKALGKRLPRRPWGRSDQRSAIDDQQMANSNQRSAVSNQRPGTSDQRQANRERQGAGGGRPGASSSADPRRGFDGKPTGSGTRTPQGGDRTSKGTPTVAGGDGRTPMRPPVTGPQSSRPPAQGEPPAGRQQPPGQQPAPSAPTPRPSRRRWSSTNQRPAGPGDRQPGR